MRLRSAVGQHVGGKLLAAKGSRSGWNWLGERGDFPWDCAGRKRALFDRNERLAADAVKEIDVALLCDLRESGNRLTVLLRGVECGCGREVAIPDVVMDALEVPEEFAGFGVKGEDRVGVKVVADPVATVEVHHG